MLSSVDRVQLVVPDRAAAVETWKQLFGAEQVGEDTSKFLNANRTTVQAGISLFEFLQPIGDGPVKTWADKWQQGLYGVGFATPNMLDVERHLNSQRVKHTREDDAFYLASDATHGMPTMIVPETMRPPVGNIRHLYEVTNPVADWQNTAALYTRIFGLDPTKFSAIASDLYGYNGTLTLFDPPHRLDRIEITQTHGGGAMDRFYQRRGPSLYMCYIETDDVAALRKRLDENNARYADAEGRPADTGLFIHPSALFGMLMGVSKTNYAWVWSGQPQLAEAGTGLT